MYDDLLEKLKIFAVRVDKNRIVFGSSYSLNEYDFKTEILEKDLNTLLNFLFNGAFFKSTHIIERINSYFDKAVITKKSMISNIIGLNQNIDTKNYCDFMFGIDVFLEPHLTFTVKIFDFKLIDNRFSDYDEIFAEFKEIFSVVNHKESIGRFVVDFEKNSNIIIGNEILPKLLNLEKKPNNEYFISRDNQTEEQNNILRSKNFFIKTDLLISNEISVLEDIWERNGKWLKVEAKILKRAYDGSPLLLGGVLYDVTDYVKHKDLEDLHSIYEFAITSGNIGIFYYNYEIHPKRYFEANNIYADMIGLTPNSENLYHLNDFEDSLLPLEDGISSNKDVKNSIKKLLNGSIDSTIDDILKIKNKKTNEIKYLLSSLKVDSFYENGKPKHFGGVIIDITERIRTQKKQIEYAYRDELTKLPNNRKLIKDMKNRTKGIGLFYDLDHFKIVNDKYGHIIGNDILKIFANTLIQLSKKYPTTHPYRLYGDEFFVYCDNSEESFGDVYNEYFKILLQKNIAKQFPEIDIQASVGIAIYNEHNSVDEFIKLADYAMYKEKIFKNDLRNKKQ